MRNISTASLAKLSQKTGTEPVCLVEVSWVPGVPRLYSDKTVVGLEIEGRILSISALDDVLNVSKSGTSQSVTVTLDDSDGQMKQYFNNVDIHKKKVRVYQWFTGIPLTDKVLLFAGIMASPIMWKESDRTLTFTVITRSSEIEVGFSPEEGQFTNLPQDQVGKVWPLVFGTVMKLPAIRVDDIIHKEKQGDAADSTTQGDHGIEDPSLKSHIKSQQDQQAYAAQLAYINFIGYLQASFSAREEGELDEFASIETGTGHFSSLAKQYLAQGNKYLLESQKIKKKTEELTATQNRQKSFNKDTIPVTNGSLFPQGLVKDYRIGQGIYRGQFIGDLFKIESAKHPEAEKYDNIVHPDATDEESGQIFLDRDKFFWNPSGQRLVQTLIAGESLNDPENVRYIVAATLLVSVRLVYAYRDYNGIRQLSIVPPNLYTALQTEWGSLPATMILIPTPLSSLTDHRGESQGWDDDIYVTCTSPVGPNTVDIIRWLVETYTNSSVDAASFAEVRALISKYPSNFAVLDRPNVISLIQEIAYLARCIVWIVDDVFHIRYLSKKTAATASITEADILTQTLEVSYTETEDLTTKVKAAWRSDYKQSGNNLVILRYNIKYYGLHEVDKDYFIYNQQFLVEKSAVFWLIRDSNTFKRVKCKVPIKFLNIETLDTVTLAFTHDFIANTPIDCVVESAILDTADYTIELTLWCPVRAGEMVEYLFAFPGSLSIQHFWPTEKDISEGRAGSGGTVTFNNNVHEPTTGDHRIDKPMASDTGNGGQLHVTRRPLTWGVDPFGFPDVNNSTPEIITRIDDTQLGPMDSKKPSGTTDYQLNKNKVTNKSITETTESTLTTCFPAKVISGGPGQGPYTLNVYTNGFNGDPSDPTVVEDAYQLQIINDDTVPANTWVIVNRVVVKSKNSKGDSKTKFEWYFQVPVWM